MTKGETSTPTREQNIAIQCPKLNESNYTTWAIMMETILKAYGLWETLKATEKVDERKIHTTKAMILTTLPKDILMQVAQYETIKEVWESIKVCIFPHLSSQMANFAAKYSIMTQEMVDSFCDNFYIPAEVHPTAPGRDKTITQFPVGKVGVYSKLFDVCGYRIPFTKFFMVILKYFRVHISQLSPFSAARVSHFEVLTCVLDLSPSMTVFRAFYTRTYSDGLFSFAKRSTSAPSCFPKPRDSIKNWADHFFWVDSCVFPIFVPLYTGGVLEKDSAPHLTTRQEQTVKLLESHKAPFHRYPECFLCLVGLSPYYPFDENSYPAFEHPDKMARGSSSAAASEIPAPNEEGQEDVAEEDAYLELADPDEGTAMVRQNEEEVVTEQSEKVKKRRLQKQSDVLPAKKLRTDHPALAFGAGGKTLAGLEHIRLAVFLDSSARTNLQIYTIVESSSALAIPVDTTTAVTTSTGAAATTKLAMDVNSDLICPSHPGESEGSDDSFYSP
ncbi:hypothetical protein Tco_0708042, partial [Tanacetum coccineum]